MKIIKPFRSLFFAYCILAQFSSAQTFQSRTDSTFLGVRKNHIITYSLITYTAASFYVEYNWWWKGNFHNFKYENDGFWKNYSLGVDKIGHFFTSYLYFNVTYDILKWANYSDASALTIACAIPAFNALSIEIGDGFSTYAFSGVDLTANMIGIGYGVLQKEIPFFQNINFKWSYYPSGVIPFDGRFRITDDYDGHIYWMSFNVYNLLPEQSRNYWLPFLNIAIGYGGKNISGRPSWVGPSIHSNGAAKRSFAISLDYNLMEIPLDGGLWNPLKTLVNHFKLPAPGIRSIEGEKPQYKLLILN